MSFGRIYCIEWVGKSIVKVEYFKIFIKKNKLNTKRIFLFLFLKYDT